MIGAGGVATVAAFKIVQNQDVFTEFIILFFIIMFIILMFILFPLPRFRGRSSASTPESPVGSFLPA